MPTPRISILIPNFNNGRASSKSGDRDFIADLFESLLTTLEHDPTPLEIIVADDGSTDDSRETCRAWAKKTWRGGQPFCRLLEFEHRGVLSAVANDLTRAARGEIICRLDGDIVCLTPNWVSLICAGFDSMPPEVGVIGPKQLGLDGRIHATGSWILHPRGHHNIAQGALPSMVTRTIEVDDVMGCFYCHRKGVWDEVGGYDEHLLRGQTEDFSLMARLKGWRVMAVPHVEYVHAHAARKPRANTADSDGGIEASLAAFRRKWGFDRLTPDLDEVARRHAGTPLLWNARVFGPRSPWPERRTQPIAVQASEWGMFASDANFRAALQARAAIVQRAIKAIDCERSVLHVGCRSGLLCHLLTGQGLNCTGVDPDPFQIALANEACGSQTYSAASPRFITQTEETRLPAENGTFDAVLLFDVLERHHNPVALLREAHRVLKRDGLLLMVTRERSTPFDADFDNLHAYRPHELKLQVERAADFQQILNENPDRIAGAIVLAAQARDRQAQAKSHPALEAEPRPCPIPRKEVATSSRS